MEVCWSRARPVKDRAVLHTRQSARLSRLSTRSSRRCRVHRGAILSPIRTSGPAIRNSLAARPEHPFGPRQERAAGWSDGARTPQRRRGGAPSHRPPSPLLPGQLLQLAFDPGHPISGTPAVDREPRRARAPSADAAGEPRRRDLGPLREPRQQVLELRQLHLQPAVERGRMLREDGEDDRRAVPSFAAPCAHPGYAPRRVRSSSTISRSMSLWKVRMASWSSLSDVSTVLGSARDRFCVYDVDDVDPRRVGRFAQSCDKDIEVPGATAGCLGRGRSVFPCVCLDGRQYNREL